MDSCAGERAGARRNGTNRAVFRSNMRIMLLRSGLLDGRSGWYQRRRRSCLGSRGRRGEAQDEALHRNLHGAHTEGLGLGERLLVGPMIMHYPVAGDGGPGTVRTAPAMDEDRPGGVVVEQGKNSLDLRFG